MQSLLGSLPRTLGELPGLHLLGIVARLARQQVTSGSRLYRQGEAGDCMHFVVTGRLQVRERDRQGATHVVTHLSSGDCVGEFSLITGEPRVADVLAVRDTLLARLGREDRVSADRSVSHTD